MMVRQMLFGRVADGTRRRVGGEAEVGALVVRDRHPERNDREHEQGAEQSDEGARDAPDHVARSGPTSASRKPRPYTVSISPGTPSLRRSAATWTSRTLVGPYQCASQIRSSSACRVNTRPGSAARHSRISNSRGVSAISLPCTV